MNHTSGEEDFPLFTAKLTKCDVKNSRLVPTVVNCDCQITCNRKLRWRFVNESKHFWTVQEMGVGSSQSDSTKGLKFHSLYVPFVFEKSRSGIHWGNFCVITKNSWSVGSSSSSRWWNKSRENPWRLGTVSWDFCLFESYDRTSTYTLKTIDIVFI